ncbi:hypothetical protein FQA39_LY09395 [Lamprigera yunnana]|nr:hypothetical protein FQA39_LY09395 [Lamprigera yunnana]
MTTAFLWRKLLSVKNTLVLKPPTEKESDWDDKDFEPFLSSSSLCPDMTKLCVSDIYSDSDNESFDLDLEPARLSADACPEIGAVAVVSLEDTCAGLYVLVQMPCKSGKKVTLYRNVGVYQTDIDEDGEVIVQFLKTDKCNRELHSRR